MLYGGGPATSYTGVLGLAVCTPYTYTLSLYEVPVNADFFTEIKV